MCLFAKAVVDVLVVSHWQVVNVTIWSFELSFVSTSVSHSDGNILERVGWIQ
jgi:hypothetical protein